MFREINKLFLDVSIKLSKGQWSGQRIEEIAHDKLNLPMYFKGKSLTIHSANGKLTKFFYLLNENEYDEESIEIIVYEDSMQVQYRKIIIIQGNKTVIYATNCLHDEILLYKNNTLIEIMERQEMLVTGKINRLFND